MPWWGRLAIKLVRAMDPDLAKAAPIVATVVDGV